MEIHGCYCLHNKIANVPHNNYVPLYDEITLLCLLTLKSKCENPYKMEYQELFNFAVTERYSHIHTRNTIHYVLTLCELHKKNKQVDNTMAPAKA